MNATINILPHDKMTFAEKLGEIIAILFYYYRMTFEQIEELLLESRVIESMLDGNSALIDSFSCLLTRLIISEQDECSLPIEEYENNSLVVNTSIKGTDAEWCGYVLGLFIIETNCLLQKALDVCSLGALSEAYSMYHIVNEKKALVELFGLDLETVM